MVAWLDNSAIMKFGKRVSKISWDNGQSQATVNTTASDTWTYDAIFNSTTLSTLKLMDLSGIQGLPYGTKQAIRCLAYGPSAKVGLVFSDPWWRSLAVNPILSGGQGHSDLNIRTCVYPSYNIGDIAKNDKEFVLLCSYTWQADAERIGSWIGQDGDEPDLINLILQDLARMHASQTQSAEELLTIITKSYTKQYYAHDWTHDPNTAGAFAFFRPGQFAHLWPQLSRANASPNFYIIGEHASAHHAWVVGALESAVAGVYQWLSNNSTLPGVSGPNGALALLKTPQPGIPFVGLPEYIEPSVLEWNKHLNTMEALLVEYLQTMKAAKK
jgi:monoamine oxidase